MSRQVTLLATATLALNATTALADPCKAIQDHGLAPAWLRKGVTFGGPAAKPLWRASFAESF